MRTLLNLSVNTVAVPSAERAQPCGTDTVNPPIEIGTYTWLSGISPAGSTSATDDDGVPAEVDAVDVPHPARATPANTTNAHARPIRSPLMAVTLPGRS